MCTSSGEAAEEPEPGRGHDRGREPCGWPESRFVHQEKAVSGGQRGGEAGTMPHALAPDRCAVAGRQRGRPHSAVAKSRTMGRLVGESSAEGFRGVPHPQTLKQNQEKGERERALGPRRSDRARKLPAEADTARRADAVPTGPTQTWAREGTWSSLAQDPVVARSEHRRHHTAAPSASARASLRAKLQPRGT